MPTRDLLMCSALIVAATAAAVGAGEITIAHVGIVLDAPPSFSERRLATMTEETAAIWRPYGVTITWLTPLREPEPGPADVRVVVRMPLSPHGRRTAGALEPSLGSVVFVDGIPDGVITIRPETVEAAILAARWNGRSFTEAPWGIQEDFAGRALGRVLAHELGHYLLAQKSHTQTGLMRATFKGRELVATDRRAFQLQPRDLAALGTRLAQFMATSPGSPGFQP